MDVFLDQLNQLIESRKKENKSLKTIVDVIRKNSEKQSTPPSVRKKTK